MTFIFRRKILSALVVSSYLTTLAPSAFAQPVTSPSGPDAVYLKDNNVIRGTLSEIAVGDHVTVLLTSGQTARILWAFVARIDHNGQPVDTSARTPPVSTPSAPTTTQPLAQGSVTVHLEGADVTIEQMSSGGWAAVCATPCDRPLAIGPSYRIVGDGVRGSRPFMLAGQNGDRVVLDVDTASKGGFVGGIVLISLGAPFIVIGGFTLLIVAALNSDSAYHDTGTAEAVGWTMFGGGIAGLVTGIVLVSGNSSTKVQQSLDAPKAAAWLAGFGAGRTEARNRLPTFHEDTTAVGIPKAPVVPLFAGSF